MNSEMLKKVLEEMLSLSDKGLDKKLMTKAKKKPMAMSVEVEKVMPAGEMMDSGEYLEADSAGATGEMSEEELMEMLKKIC